MSPEKIQYYQCKSGLLPGSNYAAIAKIAWRIFNTISAKSKRRPYIRSAYFNGGKVFLDNFWPHLLEKNLRDRYRRLRFFKAALELIRNSRNKPFFESRNQIKKVSYYRFMGQVSGQLFIVQIKEDLRRSQKFLMSAFEYNEK